MLRCTLLPAARSSTCTLLQTEKVFVETPKDKLNRQVPSEAAGPIAFAAYAKDEFADFAWLDDEGIHSVGGEDAQALDDLLRLESVFGDAEVDRSTASSNSSGGCCIGIDAAADLRDEKTARCMEDALEGDDTEGLLLLFDDDLQDALLALPDSGSGEGKGGYCFDTDASGKTADCNGYDTTSDNTAVDSGGYDTTADGSVSDSSVAGPAATAALPPATGCGAQLTPAALPGEYVAVGFNTADATATGPVEAAGQSGSGSGGGPGGRTAERRGHVYPTTAVPVDKVASPAGPAAAVDAAAAHADTASTPGVPTRLIDAIDLWESANAHAKARKKAAAAAKAARERKAAAAAAAAAAARGAGGHRVAVATRSAAKKNGTLAGSDGTGSGGGGGGGGGGGSSSNVNKKKQNEFGKRRRSSGGGGSTPPALDAIAAAPAATAATKAKTKAKGKGKGKGKKVDPLVAVRDARSLSRKPLIVQWLKSDGCDSDAEAEAALGRAVGNLSAISRYWSGGG